MSKPMLTFVTGNANKLKEVRAILASAPSFPFELVNRDLDTIEVQGTTQDVARAKCSEAAKIIQGPVITEDTALGFSALKDLPGAYIKDFLKALGHDGASSSALLLEPLALTTADWYPLSTHLGLNSMLAGFEDKSGTALCTFAYSSGPGAEVLLFEGRTAGNIVPARGPSNFGWDPIFEVQGTGKTYAEMSAEEKNKLSHRYKALALLQEHLLAIGRRSEA
ncbi:putative HAM1-protein [Ceraceosorus guamensis]|uniref:Inosine triphosphate pyrophosphatase n=1 Tax=Ceraceosorus guamensis TaxID=1522189 RepID=A0A316WEH8_9BASI|nr:putative HAM1-protein [Ceraceosorus guamensis]PWN46163.1 putative HAM1-protein [Ceraceosorus guamensis]